MTPSKHGDQYWMTRALELAKKAYELGEVPVGALVVLDDVVIGQGFNSPITNSDPTAHAEVVALRDAGQRIQNYRMVGATLYVTIEPCTMCAGAIVHSRVGRVVYGAAEPKAGAVVSAKQLLDEDYMNYKVEHVGGILEQECSQLISDFFAMRREQKKREKLMKGPDSV